MNKHLWPAGVLAALFLSAAPAPGVAADSIAAIVANPEAYDGKTIDVTGNVTSVQSLTQTFLTTVTHWYRVELCDDDDTCIVGVRFVPVKIDTHRPVRVTGTYWWSKHESVEPFTFNNLLEIKSLSQPQPKK